MHVQYLKRGGEIMSTLGKGDPRHQGDITSISGNIMSTSEIVSTSGDA